MTGSVSRAQTLTSRAPPSGSVAYPITAAAPMSQTQPGTAAARTEMPTRVAETFLRISSLAVPKRQTACPAGRLYYEGTRQTRDGRRRGYLENHERSIGGQADVNVRRTSNQQPGRACDMMR